METNGEDGLPDLAVLLGVAEADLRAAIGDPWGPPTSGPDLGPPMTFFAGLTDPRAPDRPLAVIRVDHEDQFVEVGYAVGVPLPNGRMRWSLAEPRTGLPFAPDDVVEAVFDPDSPLFGLDADDPRHAVLEALRSAIVTVADAATLRGTTW